MTVLAAHTWPSNAALIRDVSRLGYLGNDGSMVLDVTYGRGKFWSLYRPNWLVTSDIRDTGVKGLDYPGVDFRDLPFSDDTADVVVMDPDYRLNGTPDRGDFDDRYGTNEKLSWQERMKKIHDGIKECGRVLKPGGYFLLKAMDQVCSGQVRWQTIYFPQQANACGMTLIDRFDMIPKSPRPQPEGRRQVHAYGRPSTLLVFRKRKPSKKDGGR